MEGDTDVAITAPEVEQFQSTPSAWRETHIQKRLEIGHAISIHSLRMEGDRFFPAWQAPHEISIHSLRMEGDLLYMALS